MMSRAFSGRSPAEMWGGKGSAAENALSNVVVLYCVEINIYILLGDGKGCVVEYIPAYSNH